MSLLQAGLVVAGSTLVSKGVAKAIDVYAPDAVKSFMQSFGTSSSDVGAAAGDVARSFFGGTADDPLSMSDMPSVSPVNPVSTAAARIAAPGKVPMIPMGNNNRVAELSNRPNVQTKIAAIPTVGVPSPRVVSPNISVGKSAVGKVKVGSK